MGVLEQIEQMKSQGIPEQEIASSLQQQGIPPNEITNAIEQSHLKNAVAGEPSEMPQEMQNPETYTPTPETTMPQYTPQTQEIGNQETQQYPQETYQQDYANYSPQQNSSDTIIEISEQVFSEKIKQTQKQMVSLIEFKTINEVKIQNIEQRLEKVEQLMNNLQIEILKKIGSYFQNIESTKKELKMVQDSMKKIVKKVSKKKK